MVFFAFLGRLKSLIAYSEINFWPVTVKPGGGTPLFGLYGDVPLDGIWFLGLAVLNRVCNLTCLRPKQCQNLS